MRNKILLILSALVLTACPGPEPIIDEDVDVLTQYKWYAHFENIDISDDLDYAWMQRGYTYLFFLEDGTGRNYTWQRSEDSDGDIYRGGDITRFTYSISQDIVYINYDGITTRLRLSDMELIPVEGGDFLYSEIFKAQNITKDDYNYIPRTGICGDGLTFVYENDTYELTISGKGDMFDYTSTNQPWNDFYIMNVVIEEGVTSVGKNAFNGVQPITEVELPTSLTRIADYAFSGSLLSEVAIPKNVREIGVEAFSGCEYLKKMSISDENNLVTIGDWAFVDCKKLSFNGLTFSENLRSVGNHAFLSCSVGNLKFEEGIESIGHGAFAGGLSNKELILPNTLKSIGSLAFDGVFSKIVLGTGIENLSEMAFISSAKSGSLYVNKGIPLDVDGNLIYDDVGNAVEKNWTLYVPKGCKSVYSSKSPWNKFKEIIEDGDLAGSKENDDENNDDGNDDANSGDSDLKQDQLDEKDKRRGYVADGFSSGTGTSSDPYVISSAAELRYFSDAVRGGNVFKNQYIKLGADIVINENVLTRYGELNGDGSNFEPWIPIGRYNPSYYFCGTFDGNGYTISGLYCNRPEGENVGLFGNLYGNIKNVVIKDSYFKGKTNVGGVVGNTRAKYISSTIPSSLKEYYQNDKTISIISCINEAMVTGDKYVGGIVGYTDNIEKITKSANDGYIYGNSDVGGIVGKSASLSSTKIIDCINTGYVRGDDSRIGGIIGNGYGSVLNCLNTGDVKSSGKTVGGIGGVIGKPTSNKVTNCLNISTELVGSSNLGAILGYNNGVTVSYNYYLFKNGLVAVGSTNSYTNGKNSNNSSLTESELKSTDILNKLNARVQSGWSKWKTGQDGFPVLEWIE